MNKWNDNIKMHVTFSVYDPVVNSFEDGNNPLDVITSEEFLVPTESLLDTR